MIILPAIDLMDQEAVRLYKGDFERKTVYSSDPVSVAMGFESEGASYIHLVDLDGARRGMVTSNSEVVREIKKSTSLFVEVGGGIRDEHAVRTYLEDIKADRVILGTKALEDLGFLKEITDCYGERIAVSIDIRNGLVAVRGWEKETNITLPYFLERLAPTGIGTIIVTDISRDGTLEGSNRDLYRQISESYFMKLIASGGVSGIDDIRALKDQGLYGAIIGKAYYEGRISIREALEVAE